MFGFFPLIESFFFLSLGITFILIFLMVFHFKQRIEKLERKNNDLSDLCNKIVKELTNLHSNYLQSSASYVNINKNQPKEHICENVRISTSIPVFSDNQNQSYKKIVVMDSVTNNNDFSESSEIDDDSTDDYDNDYDDTDIQDDDTDNDDEADNRDELNLNPSSKSNYKKIMVVMESVTDLEVDDRYDSEVTDNTNTLVNDNTEVEVTNALVNDNTEVTKVNDIDGIEIEIDIDNDFVTEKSETKNTILPMNYQKMNVQNLRVLAISKGLCSDTSKMKRAELIKLLTDEENEHYDL